MWEDQKHEVLLLWLIEEDTKTTKKKKKKKEKRKKDKAFGTSNINVVVVHLLLNVCSMSVQEAPSTARNSQVLGCTKLTKFLPLGATC
jgi:hypothetical protein